MKSFTFSLPDQEAEALDANIALLRYAYPDLTDQDALVAIIRIGTEQIARRLEKLAAHHAGTA